ncbi:hypothetical protein CR513_03188, partial [Mucuna pruriens]
ILDSETINHMTLFFSHLTSYSRAFRKQLITVVNGDRVPVVGSDNIQLQPSLFLHNVLHDLASRRTILISTEHNGL